MKKTLGMLSLMGMLALASCALPPAPPPRGAAPQPQQPAGTSPMQTTLTGTFWRLAAFRTQAGFIELNAANEGMLQFGEDGALAGHSGCNSFAGSYEADGDVIKIAPGPMTMRACEDALMVQEVAVMQALPNARTFKIDGQTLQFFDGSNSELLRYKAEQPLALAGTKWAATMINNGAGAVASLAADSEVNALFDADGRVSGRGGCNNYNGPFTLDGNNIKIGPVASTMMACDEATMKQEMAYFKALENTTTYSIRGNTLELRAADGALQVSFTAAK